MSARFGSALGPALAKVAALAAISLSAAVAMFGVAPVAAAPTTATATATATPQSSPAADPRRSGFDFMTPALQSMQRDDALNPALLWVEDGAALWSAPGGPAGTGTGTSTSPGNAPACVACHGAAAVSMRGVAARYPAFDRHTKRPIDLRQRINQCRVERQHLPALAYESQPLLSLESHVAFQSRGLPVVDPSTDPRLAPAVLRGAALYSRPLGQLDFSCAQCHDANAGKRLGGSVIPQAHPNGYPIYRLEWQGLGSLQRRLRNCMTGVRAEPFAYGAAELVEIELYLMQRAAGMLLEAPAVRP